MSATNGFRFKTLYYTSGNEIGRRNIFGGRMILVRPRSRPVVFQSGYRAIVLGRVTGHGLVGDFRVVLILPQPRSILRLKETLLAVTA